MEAEGMDAYYVPSGDFHGSEYVNAFFRTRSFLSGFTGSAGDLLVTADGAWLWTDGRYFLQAAKQLAGSGIELMKMAEEGVPTIEEFLKDAALRHNEESGSDYVIGFDGRVVPARFVKDLSGKFEEAGCRTAFSTGKDLGGMIWEDRPQIVPSRAWELPLSSAGIDTKDKIEAIREEMKKQGATHLLLTDLMECAWLLNLRASDVLYTPVFFAFILLTHDTVDLYVMDGTLPEGLPQRLSYVCKRPYGDVYKDVAAIPAGSKLWLDPATCNSLLYGSVSEGVETHEAHTPAALMKMIKNDTEIAGMSHAHILDGVAVTKMIKWLKETAKTEAKTELGVAERLREFRLSCDDCFDLSFETIAGYGPNGAIIHYSPTPETDAEVKPEGFMLVDSGGQYRDGTTDITRTIAVGPLTQKMIDHYTYVLRSHLAFAMYKIAPGTDHAGIDKAARKPLADLDMDFNHGIAHGVGHVLSVHEGPNTIKKDRVPIELQPGMIMSNEPGNYIEGEFGIRIENLVVFKSDEEGNIVNEPLTCVPYERLAINKDLLTPEEIAYVDNYHEWVRNSLTPLLDEETAAWLADETAPL